MNKFNIVVLSFLLSIHCGIQSFIADGLGDDLFNDDALAALIDDIHYYDDTAQAEDLNHLHQNILDQDDDMSQVSDGSYHNNAIEMVDDNDIEAQQNNYSLIIPSQAGQQAYDDVYSQLRKIDEPDNSKNNKYARAQATNARNIAYNKAYRQTDKGKASQAIASKKYNKSPKCKATSKRYRQTESEKARRIACNKVYCQSAEGKAAHEKRKQKRRAMQHGAISVDSQIDLVDQPELVENSNNVGGDLYQNENIDNEIDDLFNGFEPHELF